MTQDAKDFVAALATVSEELAEYAEDLLGGGASFAEVQERFKKAYELARKRTRG